ncbi:MAG: hypothetical protein ABI548_06680 [Polyangiaceae bacterium]
MTRYFALFPVLGLSALLTHCALTDHYEVASDAAGVGSGGARGDGGTAFGAAGGNPTAGGANGGASTAGEANGGTSTAGVSCMAGLCNAGWVGMSPPPSGFVPRTRAASCAMGSDVFIWGGSDANSIALDTGAIYSPASDSWTPVSKGAGMPSPRTFATAVWTGSVVVVYGGTDNGKTQMAVNSGAVYDPKTGIWTALPNAPSARSQPIGYWDGNRAVFWGGTTGSLSNIAVAGADRFDLTRWTAANDSGDPGALVAPAFAFDGSALYLQGGIQGNNRQDRVYSYTGGDDKWAALTTSLSARSSAFGVWDGSNFVVWGGNDGNTLRNDGKYMTGATWTTMNTTGAPSARILSVRRSGWGFEVKPGVSVILGGQISLQNTALLSSNGATYDSGTNEWTALGDWPSGEDHEYGVGVWTGQEFVLWSGRNGGNLTGTGERLAF